MKISLRKIISQNKLKFRFILVGIWNSVFGYLVFILFETLFTMIISPRYVAYMSAMVLGQVIGVINAFIFHKCFTFRSNSRGIQMLKEFFRFIATYVFTFILSLIFLPIFVELLNIRPKIAGAVVILILTVVSYLGHSRFSFKKEWQS